MTQPGATAILIFSRTAREEGRSGRYGASPRKGASVARQLILHTAQAAGHTGLDVIRISSGQQRGVGFGERFANAIGDVFALGYEYVVALGTDTPGITTKAIRCLAQSGGPATLVAGPAPDGGIWGIGIPRALWDFEQFSAIGWQTVLVQQDLSGYASAHGGDYRTLSTLTDLDDAASLAMWIHEAGAGNTLARAIQALFTRPTGLGSDFRLRSATTPIRHSLRGPPVLG